MTTEPTVPDAQVVREIAQDALTIAIRRGAVEAVEVALIASGVAGPVVGKKFDVWTCAVAVEYQRMAAALSWPDEQPQDGIDPYHGDMPDDDEFMDVLSGASSMYAEVTAFQRLVATIGVEQAYRKWRKLQQRAAERAKQPQTESGECEGCGCCTRAGCHRFADATCPTDSLGDSVCPCTED